MESRRNIAVLGARGVGEKKFVLLELFPALGLSDFYQVSIRLSLSLSLSGLSPFF